MSTDVALKPTVYDGAPAGAEVLLDQFVVDPVTMLTDLAGTLNVTSAALTDAVRDVASQMACEQAFGDTSDLLDELHDEMAAHARCVNSAGLPAQLAFLVEHLGAQGTALELEAAMPR